MMALILMVFPFPGGPYITIPLCEQLGFRQRVQDQSHLPRDLELQINTFGGKKAKDILPECGFEIFVKNDVIPIRLLNLPP